MSTDVPGALRVAASADSDAGGECDSFNAFSEELFFLEWSSRKANFKSLVESKK